MEKEFIIKDYNLNKRQIILIEKYLHKLKETNKSLNLVGDSTIAQAWDRHVNDSLQLSKYMVNKNSSIIDLGTGAGIPGILLSILGYNNILLVDSKLKKINFIKEFVKENKLSTKYLCARIENLKNNKFDFIICRAFAPLVKLLDYSLIFTKKNTSLLFLKGRSVNKEIKNAKKNFKFKNRVFKSKSLGGGFVLQISNLSRL